MSARAECHTEVLSSEAQQAQWIHFAETIDGSDMHQCPWWSAPLAAYGIQTHVVSLVRGNEIVGGGLFRILPALIPGYTTAECLDGPVFRHWDAVYGEAYVNGIRKLAHQCRALEVRISGCRPNDLHADLVAELEKGQGCLRGKPDHAHAVIGLADRSWLEIEKTFNRRTRTAMRKARQNALIVKELKTDSELRQAHSAWLASAARKDFTEVRPWRILQPVLRRCVDRALGVVIGSYRAESLLAAIFFTRFRQAGRCIYAGHYDDARSLFGNHVLQATAARMCQEWHLRFYDLDVLSLRYQTAPDGVDQYKLGFGTTPIPSPHTIVWERCPRLNWLAQTVRNQPLVKAAFKRFRRGLIRRGRCGAAEVESAGPVGRSEG